MNNVLPWMVLISLFLCGCQTNRVIPVSQRSMAGLEKVTSDNMVGLRRAPNGEARSPEIYVKQSEVKIEPAVEVNTTGSLFVLDDERNYFFTDSPPLRPGRYLTVRVASHRVPRSVEAPRETLPDGPLELGDDVVDEILASLPHLGPAEAENRLLSSLRMRIDQVHPNGDVMVSMQRRSQREYLANSIDVRARLPSDSIRPGGDQTTNDLVDIHWRESQEGQVTLRHSAQWEDEYTARLSGFEEAMSQQALELARKERQLQESRERLENRLKAMGSERKQLARERAELQQMRQNSTSRIQELEKQVADKEEELNRIRPLDDKPGDQRDGASGR